VKPSVLLALLAASALCATACVRLNTPEKKAGYAVGESIGKSLEKIKDKVDLDQVGKGLDDQAAGKPGLKDEELAAVLGQLSQGQSTDTAKTGYAVGLSIGRNVKAILAYADLDMIKRGIKDELAGKPKLDDTEMRQVLQDMSQKQQTEMGARNKTDGDSYLAQNKTRPGVKVTASGLQYEILRAGSGRHPKTTDTVTVDYVGTLTDGTKFDSSYDRHQPASFPVTNVIKGWTEGLQLMSIGSKFRFVIPSDLGYGERGAGGQIGPNAVLVFEVELLKIEKTPPQKPGMNVLGGHPNAIHINAGGNH
jgi:FKBP-type peptidyl-prolyl cis-trans isomerase